MHIVVLDAYTLNPGDLDWERLQKLGSCHIYDRTHPEEVVERAKLADIILTNKVAITADMLRQLPALKYIGVMATGYNIVDLKAAIQGKIPVTNVPAYSTLSVAQTTFAHILHFTHHVGPHAESVRNGDWTACPDFCYWNFPLIELQDRTLGIIGLGRIGKTVAKIAAAFGMQVIFHDVARPLRIPPGTEMVILEDIFRDSDFISLHCPLTAKTEKIVNAARLQSMKSTAFIINTSRGQLIDEPALAEALNSGRISGAGLDVLSLEPPAPDNPLLTAKNCNITPHFAWATQAARQRLLGTVVQNIRGFMTGKPQNVVNL